MKICNPSIEPISIYMENVHICILIIILQTHCSSQKLRIACNEKVKVCIDTFDMNYSRQLIMSIHQWVCDLNSYDATGCPVSLPPSPCSFKQMLIYGRATMNSSHSQFIFGYQQSFQIVPLPRTGITNLCTFIINCLCVLTLRRYIMVVRELIRYFVQVCSTCFHIYV